MSFLKKNYKIIVFIVGSILLIVGSGIIMFKKTLDKCEIITVKNDYYVINADANNYLNVPLYFSINDSVFVNKDEIKVLYLSNETDDDIIPLTLVEINYLKMVKENGTDFYQYDFKLRIDLNIDALTIYDNIYLNINYESGNTFRILIGSLSIYNYLSNEDLYYTSLKGIVKECENTKMLMGVLIKLNMETEIDIIEIISLNNKVAVDMQSSMVVDYINENETPIDLFVDKNYNLIGKNFDNNTIKVSSGDYLLIYLKYDRYTEISCQGFVVKYVVDNEVYEKVINPFQFYKTNSLDQELVRVTYEANFN